MAVRRPEDNKPSPLEEALAVRRPSQPLVVRGTESSAWGEPVEWIQVVCASPVLLLSSRERREGEAYWILFVGPLSLRGKH